MSDDDQLHDVRLVPHHMRRQILKTKEHQAYLDSLEDVSELCETTETKFEGNFARRAAETATP